MRPERVAILVALPVLVGAAIFACTGNWCTSWGSKNLCDDFDNNNGAVAQEGLPQQLAIGDAGGMFVLSSDAPYSAPNSALGTTNPFEGGAGSGVQLGGALWQGAQAPPSVLTCLLELQPLQLSSTPNDVVVVVALAIGGASGPPTTQLSLAVDTQGNVSFREDYPAVQTTAAVILPAAGGADGGASDGSSDALPSDADLVDATPQDALPPDSSFQDAMLSDAIAPDGGVQHQAHNVSAPLSVGYWTPIQMQFSQNGNATLFSVNAGSQATTGTLGQAFPSPMTAALLVGPTDVGGASSGWSFLYDNVVCY